MLIQFNSYCSVSFNDLADSHIQDFPIYLFSAVLFFALTIARLPGVSTFFVLAILTMCCKRFVFHSGERRNDKGRNGYNKAGQIELPDPRTGYRDSSQDDGDDGFNDEAN